MLQSITPFRQLARFYGSVLNGSAALTQIAARPMRDATPTLEVLQSIAEHAAAQAAASAALSSQIGEALQERKAAQLADVDLYDRLGLRLILDRNSLVDRSVIDAGFWEPEQVAFLTSIIRRQLKKTPIVFLDLGSYWGLYSLLAMRAGVQTVHAFDADRHNFAQMQTQVFLNDATSVVTAYNMAISSTAGMLTFWDSRTHPGGNRAGVGVVPDDFPHATYKVPAVSIDEFLPMKDQYILIKMDLESHEPQALRGLVETVRNNKVVMQIECFDYNTEAILAETNKLGLRQVHSIAPDVYFTNVPAEDF